jgi:hypothetical protein
MLIAIWIAVMLGLTLWSALGWGLYRLLRQDQHWLGDLKPLLDEVPYGEVVDRWLPGWRAMAELAIDLVQWVLGTLGGAAPVVVWAVWGVGTLLLVGGGAFLSLLVVVLRDKPAMPARPA